MSDPLDFLDTQPAGGDNASAGEQPAPAAEPHSPPAQPVVAKEPVAPAPKDPAEVIPPAPKEGDTPAAKAPDGFVPISALLDERDKRKAEQQRAQAAEERAQGLQPQAEVPDPVKQPAEYAAYQDARYQMTVINERMNTSERFTRMVVKDDAMVDAARDWASARFEQEPEFAYQLFAEADPYGKMVELYKQSQKLGALGDDAEFAAFQAWKAEQAAAAGGTPAAEGQAATPPQAQPATPAAPGKPALPPKSLASEPNAGGGPSTVPVGSGTAFEGTFK